MARVAGIDLPKNKRVDVALRYIYGIGPATADMVVVEAEVDPTKRVKDLSEEEVNKINTIITKNFKVEGDLRREIQAHIRRLMDIGSYRGYRHRRSLPVRGQRTKTNARTRRGKRRTVGASKAAKEAAAK
ncbi:MAG: 30S ribosomal protein S13 [Elusimicrobia bacterium RIFOXYB2_FULL_49_7]|nr:MAG: 30S ribosomal protein S13 [Elusimicrobia bacterium RIFOXYB2_FULL_49_7]